jgi:acetyl-CoA carboxylase carboxyl transferase subunit beta
VLWFKKKKEFGLKPQKKKELPDGLWLKCEGCSDILYRAELERNLWICGKCNYHFRIGCRKYVDILFDEGELHETDGGLSSTDPLGFPKYREKLQQSQKSTGLTEGILTGQAKIDGHEIVAAMTDFDFIGGSMGSVVGERVARAIRLAIQKRVPLVILTASGGGARMQEGIFSLMQMAKTSAALAELSLAKVPYITILTHPTMAGVMASFASLGDVIIAEPGALLGFTGPRVIQQTIGEELPEGFQRSEFLLEHGMVDMIVARTGLRPTLARLLKLFYSRRTPSTPEETPARTEIEQG